MPSCTLQDISIFLTIPRPRANWLDELIDLTADIKANKDKVTRHQTAEVRDYRRRGQSRIDFIIAENSLVSMPAGGHAHPE